MNSRLEALRERRLADKEVFKMKILQGIVGRLVLLGLATSEVHDVMELIKSKAKRTEDLVWPKRR